MRKLLIAICAAGALLATASYADPRVETLDHFMSPHPVNGVVNAAGAQFFSNYSGYVYARGSGRLTVFGAIAAGTEADDICEIFQSAELVEVIQSIHTTQDGLTDTCKY